MLNRFSSASRKLNRVVAKINPNNLVNTDLTGSLLDIKIPSKQLTQSQTRSNSKPTTIVNNKNKIKDFYDGIFGYGIRSIQRNITNFDVPNNTLIINNVILDYGTELPSPENFEILVFGLHIPGNYTIEQVGKNVEIHLLGDYIDFENTNPSDIYVIGKLNELNLDTEDYFDLNTEDGENIIL
jgi:hypothetical protein